MNECLLKFALYQCIVFQTVGHIGTLTIFEVLASQLCGWGREQGGELPFTAYIPATYFIHVTSHCIYSPKVTSHLPFEEVPYHCLVIRDTNTDG